MLHKQILSNKKTKKKLPWILISFGLFALFCIVSVFGYYGYIFSDFKINASPDHFGQFGDFIGGTLNPILAFLSFMALLYTIKIQTDELKLSREELEATREELKESRIAQQEQSESLKLQNEATNLQIFENTFFQLLNQHNEYLDLVVKENIKIDYFEYIPFSGNTSGRKKDGLKLKEKILLEFRGINQTKRALKNYFMTLFQILKYIDKYAKRNKIDVKFYTNIIRALIDDEILRLLAINCVAYNFTEYKEYIEKYAFFEHIYLNESNEEIKTILEILSEYKLGVFDKNEDLIALLNKKAKTEEIPAFVKAE